MLCILYVTAVGALLGIAGILIERTLPPTVPRRWLWCVIMPISIALPGYYRAHHTWSVSAAVEQPTALSASDHALGSTSHGPPATAWWARIGAYDPIITWAWPLASALLIICGLSNAWRVSRVVRRSRRRRDHPATPAVVDGVPVVVTDRLGPATAGLWRSRVLVPRWVLALSPVQRRYVLRHEEEHRVAHDAHLVFAASLTVILMPWNLALWWQLRRLRLAVEMDCDHRVVRALGDATAYGELLLKVAHAASRGPRLHTAFLGGAGMLERRLRGLLAPAPLRQAHRFLLPAVACALLFVVLSMPHPVVAPGADPRDATNTGTMSTAVGPQDVTGSPAPVSAKQSHGSRTSEMTMRSDGVPALAPTKVREATTNEVPRTH